MENLHTRCGVLAFAVIAGAGLRAAEVRIDDLSKLEFENARAENTKYHGKQGLKMVEEKPGPGGTAILKGLVFRDGEIDLEVSGAPSKTADPAARGFIGIVFRIQPD